MSAEKEIDANIEKILNAVGTSLKHYTLPHNRIELRNAMREVMSKSYIQGSNDATEIFWGDKKVQDISQ